MKSRVPLLLIVMLSAVLWHLADRATLAAWKVEGGGELARAQASEMLQEMEGVNLLRMDLVRLREQFAALPGVAEVKLRRRLPDFLHVQLSQRRPLAVWDEGILLDVRGQTYKGASSEWLPVFAGPKERAAGMAEFYIEAQMLLTETGSQIAQLQVDDDGQWRIFLQDGAILYLGREDRRDRLLRYARHAGELQRRFAKVRAVDLRYEKGFSVSADDEEQT